MTYDTILILKDTNTTSIAEFFKVVEARGGTINKVRDIDERCSICGIPCFYVFFSFTISSSNYFEVSNEFERNPYCMTWKLLHAY